MRVLVKKWILWVAVILLGACGTETTEVDTSGRLDVLLRGGDVYSGIAAPIATDVGIIGDRIVAVGDLGDREALQKHAHKLKGSFGTLHAMQAAAVTSTLETSAAEADDDAMRVALEHLHGQFASLLRTLRSVVVRDEATSVDAHSSPVSSQDVTQMHTRTCQDGGSSEYTSRS